MLLSAHGEAANDCGSQNDLFDRAEKALAAARNLHASLQAERSSATAVSLLNRGLAAELKALSDELATTARNLLGATIAHRFDAPRLATMCEETGRVRMVDPHVTLAKEALARIAAQLAGREPDEWVRIELAGDVAFDDEVWRYDDFVQRAERAFLELAP